MPPPSRFAAFKKPAPAPKGPVKLLPKADPREERALEAPLGPDGEPADMAAVATAFGLIADSIVLEDMKGAPVFGSLVPGKTYLVTGDAAGGGDAGGEQEDYVPILFGYDDVMLRHESADARVPEGPQRLSRAVSALRSSAFASLFDNESLRIPPRRSTLDEISLVHDRQVYASFVEEGASLADKVGALPTDVYCNKGSSSDAALTAAALVTDGLAQVIENAGRGAGRVEAQHPTTAFCLVRPPGHHCMRSRPNGFCLINNVAVAIRAAMAKKTDGRLRVAVVDFDVHHGDGTQSVFSGCEDVLFISTHRHDGGAFFPHTGAADDTGMAEGGVANTINVPFDTAPSSATGCFATISDFAFDAAFDRIAAPAIRDFNADVVVVSSGFDAADGDPLGNMGVVNGFGRLAWKLRAQCEEMGRERGNGAPLPLCFALEGGYNLQNVADGVLSVISSLTYPRGKPAEELLKRIPVIPPRQWDRLRRKQDTALERWKVLDEERQAKAKEVPETETPQEGEDVKAFPRAPELVPSTSSLLADHHAWIETQLTRVVEAQRSAGRAL